MPKQLKQAQLMRGVGAVNLTIAYLKNRLALVLLALLGASFGFICLGAFIWQSSRSQLVPYVVSVDKQGVVLNQGPLDSDVTVPPQVVAATLCSFITNLRQVSVDAAMQRAAITAVYSHIQEGSMAQQEVDKFYQTDNPFARGEKERVTVEIANVIAHSGQSYQIDWQERVEGKLSVSERKMRALISYEVLGGQDLEAQNLILNPLGIYVSDFVISQVLV